MVIATQLTKLLVKDLKTVVADFFKASKNDPHSRHYSWEHCYEYFGHDDKDSQVAALHLGFYLASWGMYRGSSLILQKDYRLHEGAITKLEKYKHLRDPAKWNVDEILKLKNELATHYEEVCVTDCGRYATRPNWHPGDTLLSKVILGTLGCVPAYDQFFRAGLDEHKERGGRQICKTFSERSLQELNVLATENKEQLMEVTKQRMGLRSSNVSYSPMKVLDMYFWLLGYDTMSVKEKEKAHANGNLATLRT